MNQAQANLVQFAFFGAYFLVSLAYFLISAAKGDPINKIGYKNGLVLGLLVAGVGCFLFYPAAETKQYSLFLGALIVLGAGITIIQIAANPYVTIRAGGNRAVSPQSFARLEFPRLRDHAAHWWHPAFRRARAVQRISTPAAAAWTR